MKQAAKMSASRLIMTNRETLQSLADQVEALSGPCRETDCLIWATVVHGGYEWTDENILRVPSCNLRIGSIDPGKEQRNFTCWQDNIPAYTASIASAMSLVPEGLTDLSLNQSADASQALIFRDGDGVVGRGDATGGAAVDRAARALTAASLRAIGEGL